MDEPTYTEAKAARRAYIFAYNQVLAVKRGEMPLVDAESVIEAKMREADAVVMKNLRERQAARGRTR